MNTITDSLKGVFGVGFMPYYVFTGNPADVASPAIVNVVGFQSASGKMGVVASEMGLGRLATVMQRKAAGGLWIDDAFGLATAPRPCPA